METVIAKPKKSLMASYIVFIVCGVIFVAIGAIVTIAGDSNALFAGILLLAVGLAFLGAGIGWTVVFARLPKAYITFSEGKFHFWNGLDCSPSEIDYCSTSTWGLDGALFNYGKMIISVRHVEYKLKFVKDLRAVATRIEALKAECAAVEAAQRQIAERNAQLAANQATEQKDDKV